MMSCTAVQSGERGNCIRESMHRGRHIDPLGHYWGGLPIPVEMRDPIYWRGLALGVVASAVLRTILRRH